MSRLIHLNHAGTSFPKPSSIPQSITQTLQTSPFLSNSKEFPTWISRVEHFLGCHQEKGSILITPSCTCALSTALDSFLKRYINDGGTILTSSFEHEALIGPLRRLEQLSMGKWKVKRIPPLRRQQRNNEDGGEIVQPFPLDTIREMLLNNNNENPEESIIRLVAFSHASNVTGDFLLETEEIKSLTTLCRELNVKTLLDSAQTVGNFPLDVEELGVDALAFGGHKGLLGPLGVGGLYLRNQEADEAQAVSYCDVGSVNMPALHGMVTAMSHADEIDRTLPNILADRFREAIMTMMTSSSSNHPLLRMHHSDECRMGIRSKTSACSLSIIGEEEGIQKIDVEEASDWLLRNYGLVVSGGRQCSPESHVMLGTGGMGRGGTIRFSFGPFNEMEDVDIAVEALGGLVEYYSV